MVAQCARVKEQGPHGLHALAYSWTQVTGRIGFGNSRLPGTTRRRTQRTIDTAARKVPPIITLVARPPAGGAQPLASIWPLGVAPDAFRVPRLARDAIGLRWW